MQSFSISFRETSCAVTRVSSYPVIQFSQFPVSHRIPLPFSANTSPNPLLHLSSLSLALSAPLSTEKESYIGSVSLASSPRTDHTTTTAAQPDWQTPYEIGPPFTECARARVARATEGKESFILSRELLYELASDGKEHKGKGGPTF